jgi:hypothetical protein
MKRVLADKRFSEEIVSGVCAHTTNPVLFCRETGSGTEYPKQK